ncbi:MAG: helix-turn-helix domain-containing protein [Candidatus Schekmanbacteria bacterium]|nr:helix-turn-helix domain-containing protein [Candidatus Schekmanbacteria bacterium]
MNKCALSENIIAVRKSLSLSQDDFSKEIGISKRALQNYEAGEREPGIDVLIRIAVLGQVNLDWLVFGTGLRFRDKNFDKVTQQILEKIEYLSTRSKIDFLQSIGASNISSLDHLSVMILQLLDGMSDEKKRDVLKYIEDKKLLSELIEERRKKEAA